MALSQRQNRARAQSRLDGLDLGSSGGDLQFFDGQNPEEIISFLAGEFIERVKQNMNDLDLNVTGRSSDLRLVPSGTGIDIVAPESLVYINYGATYTTSRPPVEPIMEWLRTKRSVTGTSNGRGKAVTEMSESELRRTAFAIAETIFKEGKPPTEVYSREIPKLAADVARAIAGYAVREIVQNIQKIQ